MFYLESFAELVSADLLRKLIKLVTACSFLPFSLHRADTASSSVLGFSQWQFRGVFFNFI